MCGRYTITTDAELLEKRFRANFENKDEFKPRYNAAPSQNLPVILNSSPKAIKFIHWGIHYAWMNALERKELINIRKETLEEKKTFKKLLENQRCLVLSDGFYEWKNIGGKKMPYRFTLKAKEPYAFAGLWDEVKDERGETQIAYAIITTMPNDLVSQIHTRMPVMLERKKEAAWLNGGNKIIDVLTEYPEKEMGYYQVSTLMNSATVDNKSLVRPFT